MAEGLGEAIMASYWMLEWSSGRSRGLEVHRGKAWTEEGIQGPLGRLRGALA